MKFAKELEDDLVPEWRVKYFDYKLGKKKVKAVSRALKSVNRTPNFSARPPAQTARSADRLPFTHYDFLRRNENQQERQGGRESSRPALAEAMRRQSLTMFARSPPVLVPQSQTPTEQRTSQESPFGGERQPLRRQQSGSQQERQYRYGSFVATPPEESPHGLSELELPDPALDPNKRKPPTIQGMRPATVSKPADASPDAYHVGPQHTPSKKFTHFRKDIFKRSHTDEGRRSNSSSKLKQVFQTQDLSTSQFPDVNLEPYRVLDARQDEFFSFLDKELDKIEKFYQSKEDEAEKRLNVLRDQLHEMRDRRLRDVEIAMKGGKIADDGFLDGQIPVMTSANGHAANGEDNGYAAGLMKPVHKILRTTGKIGKTTKAMERLGSPPGPQGQQKQQDGSKKDYVRKAVNHEHVPYRFAKRRLKLALQEFYRGLELLKSYALLNRTAFRKINKKYDKAVNARPTLQYMSQRVNGTHFVQSNVIESLLVAVEDLYARYFERGNHKVAVNKLKSKMRQADQSPVSFRNGMYLAAGICFGVAGIVNAAPYLFGNEPTVKTQTSYLLQIYGGYFLALLLFMLFVIDCQIWTRARVNYIFVFEFDTRHVLDWRELAEIPCFLLFLNGLFLWLNFEFGALHQMYLYWPVILIGLSLLIIAFPARVGYYHSRVWFGYSNWRLLLAGLYPVEFRDFFLGDMYCSETYALSQIELFFCLYANQWSNPSQCNSSHSRLLGFFTALPAVWRANQCLRRFYDTRNWFPHLANFAKYMCNILYYMTLSLYRLEVNNQRKAVFIVFALVNGVYASVWDVFMDWSLGNPVAKHPFLRDQLAYRRVWVYYFAIVANVILRQQWIVYAIFTSDLQHSAFASFCVGLAEVLRRGLWSVFRVENEHCNNVKQFRASRDVPLPYDIAKTSPDHVLKGDNRKKDDDSDEPSHIQPSAPGSGVTTAVDLERARTSETQRTSDGSLRQRRASLTPGMSTLRRVGTAIAAAHSQDFQKKKRPEVSSGASETEKIGSLSSDDDDDDDDDDDEDDHDDVSVHTEDETSDIEDPVHSKHRRPQPSSRYSSRYASQRRSGSKSRGTESSHRSTPGHVARQPASGHVSGREQVGGGGDEQRSNGEGSRTYLDVPTPQQQAQGFSDAEEQNEADLSEVRERISRARSPA